MNPHFYSRFFENEVSSLEILIQKADHNPKRRERLLSSAYVQLTYIKQLATSLFLSEFLEETFSEFEHALKATLAPAVDFIALRQLMAGFRRELMPEVARLPSGITASWAHIYSADNHAITSRADPSGIVISVNRKFSEISGYPPEELVGEDHAVLNSGMHPRSFFSDMWKEILAGRTWKGTVCNRNKGGGYYWVESSISPVFDDEGEIAYFVSIRTDITRVKRMEEEAHRTEERLRMSQQFANIGTWEWQIQTGDLWWSERIAPMFGGEDSEMETAYENFISAVHPDDRGKVQQAIQQCLEAQAEYDIEHRVVWPNGEVRWLHEKGDVLRDTQGVPVTMLGAVQEITQKKTFERLMLNQQKLLDIVHSTTLNYLTTQDFEGFCQHMLEGVLNLSGAEMGVIGEVLYTGMGSPYLESQATAGMNGFSMEDVSLASVFESHEWVISNAPGTLGGQGIVENYIGMPVTLGEELLGMLVLANRQGGFDQALYEFLIPFIATYGVMILSKRLQEQDKNRMVELQAAKSKAEQANRAKSEFLSSMSHELRTPLNSILGFGDLLEMSELNSTQRDQLNEIRKSSTHLLSLINDILDLAKIDAGHLNLNLEPVPLCRLLRECTPMLEQLLAERSVTLELACSSDRESEVLGDYIRVKQVAINFLSNAVKYNRRGGSVKATVNSVERGSGRFVQLSVADTGMGIPDEQHDKVFEPFNRLGRESKSIEGTGIGLSICQSLIHAMSGRIGFESEVGVGSRFWVELPEITDEERHADIHSDHSKEQEAMNDPLLSRSDTDRQVLYIEDNVANMKLMSGIVKKLPNVELTISVTAEEGIEKAKTLSPDLILVDLNLPGMSGKEALPHLRALPNLQDNQAEIVALTANAMKGDVEAGLELGFDDYLTKPIDLQKVMALLNKRD